MTTLMRNGRDRRSGKPVKGHAKLEGGSQIFGKQLWRQLEMYDRHDSPAPASIRFSTAGKPKLSVQTAGNSHFARM